LGERSSNAILDFRNRRQRVMVEQEMAEHEWQRNSDQAADAETP
jgi:hypothetical protein